MVSLAIEIPLEIECNTGMELGCKENVDSNQLLLWVN